MIDDSRLNDLFQRYRAACPDVDPGANFMPALWQKIEARHSFWFVFQRLGRTAMTACAALCLLLLVLNFASTSQIQAPRYVDTLAADQSAEKTDYTEAIRPTSSNDDAVQIVHD